MYVETIDKSNSITDYARLTKLAFAMTLGDGSLGLHGGKSARIKIAHTEKQKDYTYSKALLLANITDLKMYYNSPITSTKPFYSFHSKTHPIYTDIYQKLYGTGYKTLHPNLLKLFDYECLAYLYMDDGSLCNNGAESPVCRISTENFTYADNVLLAEKIKDLGFNINVRERKQNGKSYWYLRFPSKEIAGFIEAIKPYIIPNMFYKIDMKKIRG